MQTNKNKSDKAKLLIAVHNFLKQHQHRFLSRMDAWEAFVEEEDCCGYAKESIRRIFYQYEKSWRWYSSKRLVPNEPCVVIKFGKNLKGINLNRAKGITKHQEESPEEPQKTYADLVTEELEDFKTKLDKKDVKKKYETLLNQYRNLEESYETLISLKQYTPEELNIKPSVKKGDSEAIAIVQYSDWHVDELVKPSTVNYRNEYNPDIAKKRAVICVQNTLRIIRALRHDIKLNSIVVQLGGDFIGGYIHPELEQTNTMSPLEGIKFASELLINGIKFLQEHGDFENLIFVCNRGNHARTTKKMQSNDYAMNFEQNMYYDLAAKFSNDERMKFVVEDAEVVYVPIFNRINRFFHGHQVKSQGGIGGIGIPLYKQLHRWDASQAADYNFMCDKHTFSSPTENCNINGSLKGWDAYAFGHGFKYQEPLQSLQVLDNKRGYTSKFKIICE